MGTKEFQHKWPQIVLIVANMIVLLLVFLSNGVASKYTLPGVFVSTTGDVSDKYYLNVTPAGWTFSIWGFIYVGQCLFVGYTLSLICRKNADNYLYLSPANMIPNAVYFTYIITNCGNITWIFLWDREYLVASGIVIALMAFCLILCTGFSVYGLNKTTQELQANGLNKEVWFNRTMVQNSISFYGTWVSIATLLNFSMLLAYWLDVSVNDASTALLGGLTADLVIWFVVDIFIIHRYTNYIIMPYVTVIVALAGSLDKNFVAWSRNSTFSVILIIIAATAFVVKMIIMLWRHFRMNPSTPNVSPEKQVA